MYNPVKIDEHFTEARQVRDILAAHDFYPLVKIGDAETWVRGGHRVSLHYVGDDPAAPPRLLLWATILLDEATGQYRLTLD